MLPSVFLKKHREVKTGCVFMFQLSVKFFYFSPVTTLAHVLVKFRHKNHLVKVRTRTWFDLKYLFWSLRSQMGMRVKNSQFWLLGMSSGLLKKSGHKQIFQQNMSNHDRIIYDMYKCEPISSVLWTLSPTA